MPLSDTADFAWCHQDCDTFAALLGRLSLAIGVQCCEKLFECWLSCHNKEAQDCPGAIGNRQDSFD
jgi:hypothetical protein